MRLIFWGRGRSEEPEWIVILTVALALFIGWLIQISVTSRTQAATAERMSISYPTGWAEVNEDGAAFAAADLAGGAFGKRISIRHLAKDELVSAATTGESLSLTDLANMWSVRRGTGLTAYRVLQVEPSQLQGREMVNVGFAYLAEGQQGTAGRVLPRVMQGVDSVISGGDQLYILTFTADSQEFTRSGDLQKRLLPAWRLP